MGAFPFHEGALDIRDKLQALLALVNTKLDDSITQEFNWIPL